jgi:hypothetical protein
MKWENVDDDEMFFQRCVVEGEFIDHRTLEEVVLVYQSLSSQYEV